jgi:inosose dehydratase
MNAEKIRLGIAPIGWTNDDLPELGGDVTFEQCISEMALAGFTGCEVGNRYPKDPKVLGRYLSSRGLSVCNAWFSCFFTTREEEETVRAFRAHRDFLHAMGAKVIGCSEQGNSIQGLNVPIFRDKPVFSEEAWRRLAAGMNRLADLAGEKGMRVCLHHHMGTGVQTPAEIDRFLDMTEERVGLLYDTGHLYYSEGGQEAVEGVLMKHIGRIIHVHLKDVREPVLKQVREEGLSFLDGVKRGVFTVPGDGALCFDPVFAVLDAAGYEGWMVVEAEQDPAQANPFDYAVAARRFIRAHAGL